MVPAFVIVWNVIKVVLNWTSVTYCRNSDPPNQVCLQVCHHHLHIHISKWGSSVWCLFFYRDMFANFSQSFQSILTQGNNNAENLAEGKNDAVKSECFIYFILTKFYTSANFQWFDFLMWRQIGMMLKNRWTFPHLSLGNKAKVSLPCHRLTWPIDSRVAGSTVRLHTCGGLWPCLKSLVS